MITTEHRTPGTAQPVQIRRCTVGVLATWLPPVLPMAADRMMKGIPA